MKKIIITALIATTMIVLASGPVCAYERDMDVVADIFLVRPISLATTVLGAVAFIVALPFSIPAHGVQETGRILVAEPFNYTFARPIGDFEDRYRADQAR